MNDNKMFLFLKILKHLIFIVIIFYIYYSRKKIINNVYPDIIISPSGYNGFYTLGICNYIKNHYDINNKNIFGFSSGTFNGLYLTINKKKEMKLLKLLLKMGKYNSIIESTEILKNKMIKKFKVSDFNNRLNIGLSHINNLGIYNNFNSINDLLDCCYGSSFIPYITIKKLSYVYNNKLTLDGALYYKKFRIKSELNENVLVISPRLFGRYNKSVSLRYLIKPKIGVYNLFLLGYSDARKNKKLLDKYLL